MLDSVLKVYLFNDANQEKMDSAIDAFVRFDCSKSFRSCSRRRSRKRFSIAQKDIKINLRLYDCYETFLKLSLSLCLRCISDLRTFRILLLHFLSVMQSVWSLVFFTFGIITYVGFSYFTKLKRQKLVMPVSDPAMAYKNNNNNNKNVRSLISNKHIYQFDLALYPVRS